MSLEENKPFIRWPEAALNSGRVDAGLELFAGPSCSMASRSAERSSASCAPSHGRSPPTCGGSSST